MPTLDELEFRLQYLLEGQILRYLPGYKAEDRVYQHLASAMYNNLKLQDGYTLAPDIYVLIAHPSTLVRWKTSPRLIVHLAEALHTTGIEAGFQFSMSPTVTTAPDEDIATNNTHIIASFSNENIAETRGMPARSRMDASEVKIPPNALLILSGTKIYPISRSVINLGRRLENQIVIDDARVSRNHAQLRMVKDRFVLFDLNSTGGTYVNGIRTNKSVLHPGDVISLAGVLLVFSQDIPIEQEIERISTEPSFTISSEDPSAVLLPNNKYKKKDKIK
jgi:hypothetical protein